MISKTHLDTISHKTGGCNMNVTEKINTNQSVLGKDLLEWIHKNKEDKTEEERVISSKLYHKYVVDQHGNPKNKIYPDVFYYVNYNNRVNPDIYLAYIVRDKIKSPRNIPESISSLNIIESTESYKGSLIQEWAYFQNGSSENPFYLEGCDIVTHYLEGRGTHSLKKYVYYFVVQTSRGIKVFRDTTKSPRAISEN